MCLAIIALAFPESNPFGEAYSKSLRSAVSLLPAIFR